MSQEDKENIIYPPEETPEQKQGAKKEEEEAIRESEARRHLVSDEEAEEVVAEADAIRKKSRGIMIGEFRDWWEGKGGAVGAKERAELVFDDIAYICDIFFERKKEEISTRGGAFVVVAEPRIRDFVSEAVKHFALEDVKLYFQYEWSRKHSAKPEIASKTWEIYQQYLNEYKEKWTDEMKNKST